MDQIKNTLKPFKNSCLKKTGTDAGKKVKLVVLILKNDQ